jgi:hypothetical protein
VKIVLLAAWLAMAAATAAGGHGALRARFIGNAAVEITDGTTMLLVDFPYTSGAFGYMTYPNSELFLRHNAICLFTHAHADHFAPGLLSRVGCTVAGPSSLEANLPASVRSIPLSGMTRAGTLSITPVATEHGPDHDSYLVDWNGVRIAVTGDTDAASALPRLSPSDVLLINPWLLAKARSDHIPLRAAMIVVTHHRSGERVSGCRRPSCLVPRPGERFDLPAKRERVTSSGASPS